MFSECPSFFVLLVYNDGALNLHLHVVALPASVTMFCSAKTTQKLNMSGLDFLALVLRSSNSFDMNNNNKGADYVSQILTEHIRFALSLDRL